MREYEAGESDKRLSILCKDYGRLIVYVKGARKVKSKFLAASQMFTYGDYVLSDGQHFFSMNQADVIENFYPIRQDYDLLCQAQHVIEICEKTVPDRTPCDGLLKLLLKTLQHISRQNKYASVLCGTKPSGQQAVIVFMFRFFLFHGLQPEMDHCCICGGDLENAPGLFIYEGMICKNCYKLKTKKGHMLLSIPAQEAIKHILNPDSSDLPDINKAFLFHVNDAVLNELHLAAQLCRLGHFK
ncbi:MAG: DNA repair protein RecO [Defluviitaleaceae bacterium]|nr:DNA repair protein RecO [Defluviitaleaceae bacterium]